MVPIAAANQFPQRTETLVIHAALLVTEEERAKRLERVDGSERHVEYRTDGTHLSDTCQRRYRMYGPGADPKLITRYVVERFLGDFRGGGVDIVDQQPPQIWVNTIYRFINA